eukprot:m.261347 g.261347  ORF g.261347 m.261347 type:complete len:159 (+) comp54608_c0_seq2:133-609(+)
MHFAPGWRSWSTENSSAWAVFSTSSPSQLQRYVRPASPDKNPHSCFCLRFGEGYRLMIKVRIAPDGTPVHLDAVKAFVSQHFPGSELAEEHSAELVYQVQSHALSLADMFAKLDYARRQFGLSDQSISQTSLEQVFLSFAKHQHERPEDGSKPKETSF